MRCKLYKYLYKMLPIIRWQSFLMDRHFSRCPACQNEFAVENQIDAIGVKAESVDPTVDIWSRVEERLMDIEKNKNSRPPARQKMPKVLGSWKWAWPAAAAAVLVLVFFISPGSRRGIGGDWGENGVVEQNKKIV
ncbi:MAG: hypothetical protein GY950_35440, partial [bacterium]|nr:hypothetical protein [bacterium]